jgi:hypothetical protein
MFNFFCRRLVPAIALPLLLFATSSAYGAHSLRHETKRAHHHATGHRPAGRSTDRSHHRSAAARRASAAAAPATASATALLLGGEAVASQHDSLNAGEAATFPFQAPTSGSAEEGRVYLDSHSAPRPVGALHRSAPPTAAFTFSPAAPVVGGAVTFKDTGSTCTAQPCTYEWSDDGSPTRPIPALWPLGSGQSISFTFHEADTKYVRLVVTDTLGRTATVEHNLAVAATSKTEPPAEEKHKAEEPPVEEKHKTEPPVEEKHKAEEPPVEEKQKTEPPVEESPSGKTDCIDVPSACGYPDATNTGVPAGTKLTAQTGATSVTKAGTTIKDLAVTGEILVEANDTTVEDDEVTAGAGSGNRGIYIAPGVTGTVIDHVTCHGAGKGTQYCIFNKDSSTKIEASYLYNCGECLNGPGTIANSFFDVTAVISGEHYEDIYYGGGEGPLIVNHDTMLNPQGQTATIFASTDFGNQTTLTITNNLLAGGGYTLYGGTSCTTGGCGSVVGPVTVTGNRFSRKYYPESGYYGVASYFDNAVTNWSGNIWDETLKPVEE